jgi:hypothetical protein
MLLAALLASPRAERRGPLGVGAHLISFSSQTASA